MCFYNERWKIVNKIQRNMEWGVKSYEKKKIDSSQVFGDTGNKYMKTRTKSHNNKRTTNFQRKVSEEGFECVCLPEIVIDSLFNSGQNYCPQTLLEECKYKVKERELKWFIKYDQESSSDDDSEEEDFKKNSD